MKLIIYYPILHAFNKYVYVYIFFLFIFHYIKKLIIYNTKKNRKMIHDMFYKSTAMLVPVIDIAHCPLRWSDTLASEIIKSLYDIQSTAKGKRI